MEATGTGDQYTYKCVTDRTALTINYRDLMPEQVIKILFRYISFKPVSTVAKYSG